MAWRDSRRNRGRLLLFISSIVLGIAALVAINSFSENLQKDIRKKAKTLLGADLMIEGRQVPSDSIQLLIDSIGPERADIIGMASMAYFPQSGNTRLSFIRAIEGGYPFYGSMNTSPANAYQTFQKGKKALVDKTLMYQFDLEHGDSVKIGTQSFIIEGTLNAAPGQSGMASSIAPTIFIPMRYLKETELLQTGSRVEYQYYYKLSEKTEIDSLIASVGPRLKTASYRYNTVQSRQRNVSTAFTRMSNYLNLIGFIALLLGCIGVASAVQIYIKDKLSTVAILRTLGVSGQQAFMIYLLQIFSMGLIGAVIGAFLGSMLQWSIPLVLKEVLPLQEISASISPTAVIQGIITGLSIALLFALLPLLSIRKTSPLRTLRANYEAAESKRDPFTWLVYLLIFAFIAIFTYFQTGGGIDALVFPTGIAIAFLLLAGTAKMVTLLLKKYFPSHWSFVLRQGVANLFRPNNQTLILIVSIGLGSMLISTLFFVQEMLLDQVKLSGTGTQPNMILYDIQVNQKEQLAQLAQDNNLPIIQQAPIVTTRITEVNGINKAQYLKDTTSTVEGWIYRREFRCTYRDTISNSEEIIKGEWHGNKTKDGTIYVSIAENVAEALNADIGTVLTFNIQGAIIKTVVSSVRKIDWTKMQTNFFIVFPTGILEKAPQFHVLVTRTETPKSSAKFQQAVVQTFPKCFYD